MQAWSLPTTMCEGKTQEQKVRKTLPRKKKVVDSAREKTSTWKLSFQLRQMNTRSGFPAQVGWGT